MQFFYQYFYGIIYLNNKLVDSQTLRSVLRTVQRQRTTCVSWTVLYEHGSFSINPSETMFSCNRWSPYTTDQCSRFYVFAFLQKSKTAMFSVRKERFENGLRRKSKLHWVCVQIADGKKTWRDRLPAIGAVPPHEWRRHLNVLSPAPQPSLFTDPAASPPPETETVIVSPRRSSRALRPIKLRGRIKKIVCCI